MWRRIQEATNSVRARFFISEAVALNILTQVWMVAALPITMVAVTRCLSVETQGFYYTFGSVIGLQVFVELGLTTVLVQLSSHEWARLRRTADGRFEGDPRALARLASLTQFGFKWYCTSALLLLAGLGVGGYAFLHQTSATQVGWQIPWITLCIVSAASVALAPFAAVLEGCNMVGVISRLRIGQAVFGSLALIAGLVAGWKLYALPLSALARLCCYVWLISCGHRRQIVQLLQLRCNDNLRWKKEIWPFQWRIAVSWLSGYVITSLFVPLTFHHFGPATAGQMGMTLSLVAAIESVAITWINTHRPQFGILIADRKFADLDLLYGRLCRITLIVSILAVMATCTGLYVINLLQLPFAERMLPQGTALLFIFQRLFSIAVSSMCVYLRAHNREPMMLVSLTTALLVGGLSLVFVRLSGCYGLGIVVLCVSALWTTPYALWIFQKSRRVWHIEDTSPLQKSYAA